MPYVLTKHQGPNSILKRLDHVICRVPDIQHFHRHFSDVLGFSEAWPIGKFWPTGNTSGIALGGINLEFVEEPGIQPQATTLVFEPRSINAASQAFKRELQVETKIFNKIETDSSLLRLRGFSDEEAQGPQLICQNLLLESDFPIDMFFCDYAPGLKKRLSPERFSSPHGRVLRIEVSLPNAGDIEQLNSLGYEGEIELYQSETTFGPCQVTGIMLENGPVDLKGIDPGFRFT